MFERLGRTVLTVLLIAGACFISRNHSFLHLAKVEYALFTTFLSISVLHLRIRHTPSEFGVLALSTAALIAVVSRVERFPQGISIFLTLLGLASLAIVGIRTLWSHRGQLPVYFWGFLASLALVGSGWVLPVLLTWVAKNNPKAFDLYLYSFDASLRFQPSFLMGMAFLKSPVFRLVSTFFYMGIPAVCTLVYADQLLRGVKKALHVFVAFLSSGPIGILFYNLFPALGPVYLFGSGFPLRPLSSTAIQQMHLAPVSLYGFPNAMPSLHMTWSLLGLWYSRGASWWVRLVAQIFLVFTIVSTLGTGEHYLVDLVVAFPFSLMIFAVFSSLTHWNDLWRIRAIVFGLGLSILWMTLLRFRPYVFWISPIVPWMLTVLTVVVTSVLSTRVRLLPGQERTSPVGLDVRLATTKEFQADDVTVG